MGNTKVLEALIGKLRSELDDSNKDELITILSAVDIEPDDPAMYMLLKQLAIDTKVNALSLQIDTLTNKSQEVEKSFLYLGQMVKTSTHTSKTFHKDIESAVLDAVAETIKKDLDVTVMDSRQNIEKQIKIHITPLLEAINKIGALKEKEVFIKSNYDNNMESTFLEGEDEVEKILTKRKQSPNSEPKQVTISQKEEDAGIFAKIKNMLPSSEKKDS